PLARRAIRGIGLQLVAAALPRELHQPRRRDGPQSGGGGPAASDALRRRQLATGPDTAAERGVLHRSAGRRDRTPAVHHTITVAERVMKLPERSSSAAMAALLLGLAFSGLALTGALGAAGAPAGGGVEAGRPVVG